MKFTASLATVFLATATAWAGPLTPAVPVVNPMPSISASGISVRLEHFTTVPNGAPQLIQPIMDGSGRLAINETGGRVYLTTKAGGVLSTPYLAHASAAPGFDGGLMGLAFHPDFATNGRFYTAYHAQTGSGITPLASSTAGVNEIVIREWTASNPAASSFAGTSREVMRMSMPSQGHTVGMIAFNPNTTATNHPDHGKLYIAMGDTGDNQSYLSTARDLSVPYGKVLRIDPTPNGAIPFTVPADNPLIGQAGAEPLVWASGLRNPQYLSWLRGGAQTMFINDIGEANIEEVNTGIAGGDYGWSIREGAYATFRDPAVGLGFSSGMFELEPGTDSGLLYPIAQYDHDEGQAIGAGLVYQGSAIPALVGKYIVSDIVNGRLLITDVTGLGSDSNPAGAVGFEELSLIHQGLPQTLLDILQAPRADARLGVDDDGELYILTKAHGDVFRLVADIPAPPALPILMTGLAGLLAVRRVGSVRRLVSP